MAGPTACEVHWKEVLASFASQEEELLADHRDAKEEIVHSALVILGQVVRVSPRVNGNGVAWKKLADTVDAERVVLCKHMDGKELFTDLIASLCRYA
jgi:hypothetical protein